MIYCHNSPTERASPRYCSERTCLHTQNPLFMVIYSAASGYGGEGRHADRKRASDMTLNPQLSLSQLWHSTGVHARTRISYLDWCQLSENNSFN
jgi:hypothetical protein